MTLLVVVPAVEAVEVAAEVVVVDLAEAVEVVLVQVGAEVEVGLLLRHDQAAEVGQVAGLVVRVPVVERAAPGVVRVPEAELVVLAVGQAELVRVVVVRGPVGELAALVELVLAEAVPVLALAASVALAVPEQVQEASAVLVVLVVLVSVRVALPQVESVSVAALAFVPAQRSLAARPWVLAELPCAGTAVTSGISIRDSRLAGLVRPFDPSLGRLSRVGVGTERMPRSQ